MKREYAYTTGALGSATKTINYGYGNSEWKDLLTSYRGLSIEYDRVGNPLTFDGATLTWEQGRKLSSITLANGATVSYKYDANGIRTQKTVAGVTTDYFLQGSTIVAQKTGNNVIWYYFDGDGTRDAIEYNGTVYYYMYNPQGDVIGLFDDNLNVVVEYKYDSWGNVVSITGSLASTLGQDNPFRYRGYYYDNETGLYYLNSRYYHPEIGRFINADGYISTGQGVLSNNMFAYCMNNPINCEDSEGKSATVAGAIIGGLFGFVGALISEATDDNEGIRMNKVAACTLSGAAIGFVADVAVATFGVGAGVLISAGVGALASMANSATTQYVLTGKVDKKKVIVDGVLGAVTTGLCTGTTSTLTPIVSSLKEGIKYAGTQVAKEVATFYYIGQVGSALAMDIGFTAVTTFGAWYGGELFGILIGWCE